MSNEIVSIYDLTDPRNNEIRYVGKTKRKLKRRLDQHISNSKYPIIHVNCWIKGLLNKNLLPIINEIDKVAENEWEFWESYYISLYKSWGFKLTNKTNGGLGFKGGKHTKFTKKKLSNSKKGKNNPFFGKKLSENTKKLMKEGILKYYENNDGYWKGKKRLDMRGEKHPMYGKGNPIVCKLVIQYDLKGNFIKKWKSISEAGRNLGISNGKITDICRGRRNTAKGFIFKYKGDKVVLNEHIDNKLKPVIQYMLNGKFIKEWNSASEAEKKLNLSCIGKCCNKIKSYKTIGGFIWKFKDDNSNIEKLKYLNKSPVVQYDINNNFIKKWDKIKDAEKELNITNISAVCRAKQKTAGGYLWKYKENTKN